MRHGHTIAGIVALATTIVGVSGCGNSAGASKTQVSRPTASPTQTSASVVQTPTQLAPVATNTPTAAPTARGTASPTPTRPAASHTVIPVRLLALSVGPRAVDVGGTFTASAHTQGPVQRIVLYLSAGPAAFNGSYTLTRVSTGMWTASIAAPPSAGAYHYSVSLFDAHNVSHVVDNDAWNVQVGPPATATPNTGAVSSSIPADLPLSPPFNYSNPVAATFSAEGKSYDGAEVISNSRPDIKPSVVSQWYLTRFPRAGWTIDPGTIPASEAASFVIVATSGGQVCLVSYANSTVHEFYTMATG